MLLRPLIAKNLDVDRVTRLSAADQRLQPLESVDILPGKRGDDVARLQSGPIGGRTGKHHRDSCAFRIVLPVDAQHARRFCVAAMRHAQRGESIPIAKIQRDRNVKIEIRARSDAAMDRDHVSIQVEQRSTRVATQQRTIGLNHSGGQLDDPAQPHDGRAAFLIAARMARRDAPVAGSQRLHVRDLARRKRPPFGDLNRPAVAAVIHTESTPLEMLAIRQNYCDFSAGNHHDVCGGKHEPFLGDDHAAPLGVTHDDADGARSHAVGEWLDAGFDCAKVRNILRIGQA